MHKSFLIFTLLTLTNKNIFSSQVKMLASSAAAQKAQEKFNIILYNWHDAAHCAARKLMRANFNVNKKLYGTEEPFGFCDGFEYKFRTHIYINEAGEVIGIIASDGDIVWENGLGGAMKIYPIVAREDYRNQGIEEKLLRYHLEQRFESTRRCNKFNREFLFATDEDDSEDLLFLDVQEVQLTEPIRKLCKKIGFNESYVDFIFKCWRYTITEEDYVRNKPAVVVDSEAKQS